MITFLLGTALISHAIYIVWKLKKDLHNLQLNSYYNSRYLFWIWRNFLRVINFRELALTILAVLLSMVNILLSLSAITLGYLVLFVARSKIKEKKPLVFTKRATRLFSINCVLLIVLYSAIIWKSQIFAVVPHYQTIVFSILILTISSIFSWVIMLISNVLLLPLESAINYWYYRDAQKIMRNFDKLLVIGITGSYGKTSTKNFIYGLLQHNFNTLITPESYNTDLGVTKVIRMSLQPTHDVFIVEMGAKKRGDIKSLCDLVVPKIGVLTALGEQHLETFKTIEEVKKAKFELIEAIPQDGFAVVNMDDKNIADVLKTKKVNCRLVTYGIEYKNLDYKAENIQMTDKGSSFSLRKKDGTSAEFVTVLLGVPNIYNILAAIAVASELGVELKFLVNYVKNLRSIPHRLELKQLPQNVTIIDDAFNANPVGAKMALDVLHKMSAKRKIIITPGMIELGAREFEHNKIFGIQIAKVCDYVILVGAKQTYSIQQGLESCSYPVDKVYIAKSLVDASQHLWAMIKDGDLVLIENDLPDTYNER